MGPKLANWQTILTTLAIAAIIPSHGWYDPQINWYVPDQKNCKTEEQKPTISCQETCQECCKMFFLEANALYFRPFEGGLSNICDGVEVTNTTEDGITISRLKAKGHDPHFNWSLGYRIGTGCQFADSPYSTEAYWTHFQSHAKNGDPNALHNWHLNLDIIDALFTGEYNCCNSLTFTPFAGLRYATTIQKLFLNFVNTVDGVVASTSEGILKQDFNGLGPVFGAEGAWGLGCGFSLYGNISLSVLYGTFHLKSDQQDSFGDLISIDRLRKHAQASQQILDFDFGVRWSALFCENKSVMMQLGLEQHRFFNHNQFVEYGDLNLDGVSFALSFQF